MNTKPSCMRIRCRNLWCAFGKWKSSTKTSSMAQWNGRDNCLGIGYRNPHKSRILMDVIGSIPDMDEDKKISRTPILILQATRKHEASICSNHQLITTLQREQLLLSTLIRYLWYDMLNTLNKKNRNRKNKTIETIKMVTRKRKWIQCDSNNAIGKTEEYCDVTVSSFNWQNWRGGRSRKRRRFKKESVFSVR